MFRFLAGAKAIKISGQKQRISPISSLEILPNSERACIFLRHYARKLGGFTRRSPQHNRGRNICEEMLHATSLRACQAQVLRTRRHRGRQEARQARTADRCADDALFDIERGINGETAERRLAVRREQSAPILADLEDWMRTERAGLSRHSPVAKAMDYMLKRWDGFARFTDDGRICLSNNAAERCLRGIALGRKSWLFCGSDRGGMRAAAMYTLIGTAKLNNVDPQAWLADVLDRIAGTPQSRLDKLLPWNWVPAQKLDQAA